MLSNTHKSQSLMWLKKKKKKKRNLIKWTISDVEIKAFKSRDGVEYHVKANDDRQEFYIPNKINFIFIIISMNKLSQSYSEFAYITNKLTNLYNYFCKDYILWHIK